MSESVGSNVNIVESRGSPSITPMGCARDKATFIMKIDNSNSLFIKFFLKWLQDIGQLEKEEIGFDIFITQDNKEVIGKIVSYWAQVTGLPKDYFPHVYFQKSRRKRSKRKSSKRAHHGLLRIRVKASSMLARQISGWVKAIIDKLCKPY